jgi:hypothetical protein
VALTRDCDSSLAGLSSVAWSCAAHMLEKPNARQGMTIKNILRFMLGELQSECKMDRSLSSFRPTIGQCGTVDRVPIEGARFLPQADRPRA